MNTKEREEHLATVNELELSAHTAADDAVLAELRREVGIDREYVKNTSIQHLGGAATEGLVDAPSAVVHSGYDNQRRA